LKDHRCWKYKYEVMSPKSPYFENMDIAYSDISLRDGHTYFAVMNDNAENPRIDKLIREVVPKK
jgi:hypothetical protein